MSRSVLRPFALAEPRDAHYLQGVDGCTTVVPRAMDSSRTTLIGHNAPNVPAPPPLAPARKRSLVGHTLQGRYHLEARIDAGATGTVYRGFDRKRRRPIAVKVLHARHARSRTIVEAFAREASAAERMLHPNLVQIYAFGRDDQHLFIVMELLEGRTLECLLDDLPVPPADWSIRVVAQVLAALDAAHDAGVVHRDTKPANVFILRAPGSEGPRVKLCDFGVSRVRRSHRELDQARVRRRTAEDLIWGTPEYMAPEQARGESVDRTADIYACGVMLYEMLTGQLPFRGDTPQALALAHMHTAPPPPRALQAAIDPALEQITLRAMAKDPAERFRNAQAMRSALLAVLERGEMARPEPTLPFRHRKR